MSDLVSFEFRKSYPEINQFLTTQNQIAYTKDHKFIYGNGKEMKHTEVIKKFEDLATSLQTTGKSLPLEIQAKISAILSTVAQLTEAKLNQIIPTKKSNAMLKERLDEVNRLAVDLDIDLQPSNRTDSRVILEQKWAAPIKEDSTQIQHRDFTLRRFIDGKTELSSGVMARPITKAIPRTRRMSSTGYRTSIDECKTVKDNFSPENLSNIRKNLSQKLSQSERRSLVDQLHQKLFGERKEDVSPNFTQQLANLTSSLKINMYGLSGLDEIALEILTTVVNTCCDSSALFTSIQELDHSVRWHFDEQMSPPKIICEITRQEGIPNITLTLQSDLKADLVDDKGVVIKKTHLQADVHLNPITGEHVEKTIIL